MSHNRFRGGWRALQGRWKAGWAELQKDEFGRIEGDVERVSGIIERSYDLDPEEARPLAEAYIWEAQLTAWSKQLAADWDASKQRVAKEWPKLTADDVEALGGEAKPLIEAVERTYGIEDWQAASEALSFFRDWREESA